MSNADEIVDRLQDERSKKVVFLSHCLLNENTRYLGGACRRCCVREIVDQCMDLGIGMVQMPCPEQAVWGGVLKRRMLPLYGSVLAGRVSRWLLLPLALRYVKLAYRKLARNVAAEIDDYIASGYEVVGIVGIDASPTCGVDRTIDIDGFVAGMSGVGPNTLTVREQNDLVRRHAIAGRGLFIAALVSELGARGRDVPLLAHDLLGEIEGRTSNVTFNVTQRDSDTRGISSRNVVSERCSLPGSQKKTDEPTIGRPAS